MTGHRFHPGHPITDVCNRRDCLQMRTAPIHLSRGQVVARWVVKVLVAGGCLGGLYWVGLAAAGWLG